MSREVSFLTDPDAAFSAYRQDGYFVEPAVFTPGECDQIVAAALRLPDAARGIFRPIMHPHRSDECFFSVMRHPRLLSVVRLLAGGDVAGLQSEFFFSRPGTRGFAKHQDNFFVEAPEDAFVSAWTALVDVVPENGGLILYPGSHREGRLPVRRLEPAAAEGQDPNANNEETVMPPVYEGVSPKVPKGGVVFLHAHVVHASGTNLSASPRYALLNTYLRKGAFFRAGNYARREPIDLDAAWHS